MVLHLCGGASVIRVSSVSASAVLTFASFLFILQLLQVYCIGMAALACAAAKMHLGAIW
jgi:hypothetical protein